MIRELLSEHKHENSAAFGEDSAKKSVRILATLSDNG